MSKIVIDRAGVDDIDTLMEWRRRVVGEVFGAATVAGLEDLMRANRDYYLRAISAGSHVPVFAREGGEIVGCGGICLYDEMPSPDNPSGRCGYIMNVYVEPAHRGHRIASAIVEWILRYLDREGIGKVYLESTPMARSLYAAHGFVPMRDMFIHSRP